MIKTKSNVAVKSSTGLYCEMSVKKKGKQQISLVPSRLIWKVKQRRNSPSVGAGFEEFPPVASSAKMKTQC